MHRHHQHATHHRGPLPLPQFENDLARQDELDPRVREEKADRPTLIRRKPDQNIILPDQHSAACLKRLVVVTIVR